ASDLATLQALLSAFALEIVLIKGRTDGLESRIIDLETIQFSTTSKLSGQGLFGSNDVWGGGNENQTVFQSRVNLALITSFSGLDKLRLDLTAGNTSTLETLNIGDRAFDLAGNTAEGTLASQVAANTDSAVLVTELSYQFSLNKHLAIAVLGAQSRFQSHLPTLNPGFADLDQGAISSFAQGNPLYWLGGGGSGIITHWRPVNALKFSGGYLAQTADDSTAGQGFFNGSYSALAQLTWEISDRVSVAGLYLNNYASTGEFGFRYNDLAVTGTGIANSLAGQINNSRDSPVLTNAYGAQFSWQPSEPISVNGWLSTFYSRLLGRGDGQLWTYAIAVGWQDLGGEGNFGGIVIGAEPYLTKFRGDSPDDFAIDVPLHVETFYRRQISDNLSLTGGLIWLVAPNQDRNNSDAVIGTIRTNFIF
ncbi:MAG: iron uptake porin, partial [Cyanobacteria bacterium P01_H01_bin.15]